MSFPQLSPSFLLSTSLSFWVSSLAISNYCQKRKLGGWADLCIGMPYLQFFSWYVILYFINLIRFHFAFILKFILTNNSVYIRIIKENIRNNDKIGLIRSFKFNVLVILKEHIFWFIAFIKYLLLICFWYLNL